MTPHPATTRTGTAALRAVVYGAACAAACVVPAPPGVYCPGVAESVAVWVGLVAVVVAYDPDRVVR